MASAAMKSCRPAFVIALRNETLFYSLAFLVFALPLYITIVVALIDRRLARQTSWLSIFSMTWRLVTRQNSCIPLSATSKISL